MGLELEELRKKIQENKNKGSLNRAIEHQNRIKFHAQTVLTPGLEATTTNFLSFVKNLLPPEKYTLFLSMFRYPVKTNEVTGICFDKLSRIFEGRNPAYNYQFMESEQRDDWEYYRTEILNEPSVWSTKGWEFFKTNINSVLIVDMPQEQNTDDKYPQPYFYWLPIEAVMSYEADKTTGVMDWIAFKQDGKIVVIDDERYRVFNNKDGNIGELEIENPHDLGYCPARFFWNTPLSLEQPDIKESPLTKQLEQLDWFLFFYVSKRNLDLFGSYPILSGYEENCNYTDEHGTYCDHGFLRDKEDHYIYDSAGSLMLCPVCGKKRIVGAGTYVEVPVPSDGEPDLRQPITMLKVDRESLDYNVDEVKRLKADIITAVVGNNEEITAREAINEQQIKASFEAQSTILNRVKKGFEEAQQFVDETICKLRYGAQFISAKINYGTEFYIYSATELREQYKTAKESGASEAELDALQEQIIATEYRNNPTQLARMMILSELEPYRHLTRGETVDLYKQGLIDRDDLIIKLNFTNFVKRFERENINIIEFGSAIPYDEKINIINDKFKEYASESKRQGSGSTIGFNQQ